MKESTNNYLIDGLIYCLVPFILCLMPVAIVVFGAIELGRGFSNDWRL
jgi:hypothetical protein